ncbi:MAG TPA: helix-turn-helix transcriptional regulator [Streptosporangiaceae bacterium]|nr:helix-turn-helix transcriptional regulator [Streptosporangiaceae bacterium]
MRGRGIVKNGHVVSVQQKTYQPPGGTFAPVETMTFGRLRHINDGSTMRADFHVLAVVRRGQGELSMDFSAHHLASRSVVWIPPGVVHRWSGIADLAGDIVLFVPTAPVTPASRDLARGLMTGACWTATAGAWPLISVALAHLRLEYSASPGARTGELSSLLLSALLLRIDPPAAFGQAANDAFLRFRYAAEEDFRTHHDVAHYARRLGYSPRTLTRAVHAATGRSAKNYICERLLLEAKRLLAHDDLSQAQCGQRLGFSDAANFSAFFLRETGLRPGAWLRVIAVSQK